MSGRSSSLTTNRNTTANAPTAKLTIQKNWLRRTSKGGVALTSTGALSPRVVDGRTGASRAGSDS